MTSTTQRGNIFRDQVASLLRAAGFRAETEIRVGHKNVDVKGVYAKDELAGELLYAFEAKDYSGTLPIDECSKFANEHQLLINGGMIDHAWLISKGPISPAGRQAVEAADRKMKAMTFAELQRRLLLLDSYLKELASAYDASRLGEYYIPPETPDGEDLGALVRAWMDADEASPLFVLGPYGKGKSTFATHLAATMAKAALADRTQRVPILIRLGEIADEQAIDGLVGKVLASQHRVHNYHFETFSALNREGRFLIIYDGFDEMKHGMTPAKFSKALSELMRLDEGAARILVLGRDTAFHDEIEFRSVMDGVQRTGAGRVIRAAGRRPYRHVEIRGFSLEEARTYVRRYLPVLAERARQGQAPDPQWIQHRIAELVGGNYDELLVRPVHAQMLCEIALQPEHLRPDMSVYELFDTFVHFLLQREVDKKGRDADFPLEVRRNFNASLAWWLWERGGASTTTLADIPQRLCVEATRDIQHSLGREETRRELIQGCLVEKGSDTIYFHRSIQEFLVAEYLITTDLLQRDPNASNWFETVTGSITGEVIGFIVAGAQLSEQRQATALNWLAALAGVRGNRIPLAGFELFSRLGHDLLVEIKDPTEAPWLLWLTFFLRSGNRDFAARKSNTFAVLTDLLIASRSATRDAQAAALYVIARTLFHSTAADAASVAGVLAAMLPIRRLGHAVEEAQFRKTQRQIILHDEDYTLWSFLRAVRIEQADNEDLRIVIDVRTLHDDARAHVSGSFERDASEPRQQFGLPVQALYQALANRSSPVAEKDIDAIRPFFNDPAVRGRLSPVDIERRSRDADPVIVPKPDRPKLRPRFQG
ncbi:NACHT domain-containing protein [Sphingomonas sp. PR090111-T3T-6A]|uniref:NACHT domain-containing protein n=1 Tax=Sphingomonas sp. PR090111-T3T-6A TaxID=685778 RepID=UPI0003757962|nr:NACHT domain-containing protein [Sphingomonas sp. PR090111-T3T-6A]